MNWENFTIGKKIGVGFSLLIIIIVALGSMGVWWMKITQAESEKLVREFFPEMNVALEIKEGVNRLMYQMRGFVFTEDKKYYQAAVKELNALTLDVAKGYDLAENSVHLQKLDSELKKIEQAKNQYRKAMNETYATIGQLSSERIILDENAIKYMQASKEFLQSQNRAFNRDLDERQNKVKIVTGIVDLGTRVQVMNFKAQVAGDMKNMQKAVKLQGGFENYIADLRSLTRDALDVKRIDEIEAASQKYTNAMVAYIRTENELAASELKMKANSRAYAGNCKAFFKSQMRKMKKEFNEPGADLAQRLEKISLVTSIINLGNLVQITNFKAQAEKDPELMVQAVERLKTLRKITNNLRKITKPKMDIQRILDTETAGDNYLAAMEEYLAAFLKLDEHRREMDLAAGDYVNQCAGFLSSQQQKLAVDMHERHGKITLMNDIIGLGNETRIKTFKSQALKDPAIMEEGQKEFAKINEKFEEIRKITRIGLDLKRIDEIQESGSAYKEIAGDFLTGWYKLLDLDKTRNTLGQKVIHGASFLQDTAGTSTDQIARRAASKLSQASVMMIVGLVIAFLVGVFLAFFIAKGIISVMQKIASHMNEGAYHVASASGEVSVSSQTMAEGASKQAASIEETSSAMEQMASMTKMNAENAGEADELMQDASKIILIANDSMSRLISSMDEINKASEETSKIIKTIDEIAFQTNLLALNAAVEAARAGEAGAGFAVVADEVRNLAMRAANAAKNTADLIQETLKKVVDGTRIVASTNDAFTKVSAKADKIGSLVSEISSASSEQSNGIELINKAIATMEAIVQKNAASAEESASASEEMNVQAEQMKSGAGELMRLVGGSGQKKKKTQEFLSAPANGKFQGAIDAPEEGAQKMLSQKTWEQRE